jgi:hypothetical protein
MLAIVWSQVASEKAFSKVIQGLGFMVYGLGFRVYGLGFMV